MSTCDMLTQRNKEVALHLRRVCMCLQDSGALGGEEERGILGKIPITIVELMGRGWEGGVAPISWGQMHLRLLFIINTWRRARGDPQRQSAALFVFCFPSSILVRFFRRSARDTVGAPRASVRACLTRTLIPNNNNNKKKKTRNNCACFPFVT